MLLILSPENVRGQGKERVKGDRLSQSQRCFLSLGKGSSTGRSEEGDPQNGLPTSLPGPRQGGSCACDMQ